MKFKLIGNPEMIDEMHQHWEDQYKIVNDMSHEKRQPAIDFLRTLFSDEDKLEFKECMKWSKEHWLHEIETGWHMYGGMAVRNALRGAGFGEDYFGVEMDYIYQGLIEEAILGDYERVSKDEAFKE
jgi:hypothetical protein